jgi:hypothetical protein
MKEPEVRRAIKAHLGRVLGPPGETRELRGNPRKKSAIQYIEIPFFRAENHLLHSVFATIGGFLHEMQDGGRIEGMLLLSRLPELDRFAQIHELLASFATYAETHDCVVDMGDIIDAAAQLRPLCAMRKLVLVPPVPVAADLAHLDLKDGTRIDFAWLCPIHDREADFARAHGVPALMALFALEGVDPTDLQRRALDTDKRVPDLETVQALLRQKREERGATYQAESSGDVIKITRRGRGKPPQT